jgi:glycosyltransferase involved in cell wall biosynthesis
MGAVINLGYVGFIDISANGDIDGWLYRASDEAPAQMQILVDGEMIQSLVCDGSRPDVVVGGFSRENCGFHHRLPRRFHDNSVHIVKMLLDDGKALRARSSDGIEQEEWMVILSSEEVISQMDTWLGRDIHCWAITVDSLDDKRQVPDHVLVRQTGREVAKLHPAIDRPDVAEKYACPVLCGFFLPYARIQALQDQSPLHFFVVPGGQEIAGSPIDPSSIPEWSLAQHPPQDPKNVPGEEVADEDSVAIRERRKTREYSEQIARLKDSGLFDEQYYRLNHPDLAHADMPLFDHFFSYGYREGRRPNLYFDPAWYRAHAGDVQQNDVQPLLHYLVHGDREGRAPSQFFNTRWYRERYQIPLSENTLAHYLKHRFDIPLSPMPDFDAEFYAEKNPDVVRAKVDMFDHFLNIGYKECRNPSAGFDVKFYVQRYLHGDFSTNPFIHFWAHRNEPGIYGRPPDDEVTISRELKKYCQPGPMFEEIQRSASPWQPQAKLLAYYLPQFHTFKENDEWWGNGFTEWTNIVRGSPRFEGHYQPRVPRDLGFYSLDTTAALRKQIQLAKSCGIYGFVFYYYWFNGKRLMDKPLRQFLADPSLEMNFALMWANENWTRRWDGAESEVLISQDYRASDDLEMAAEFAEHFRDSRYIRLQGRPVLMIYRAGIIPDTKRAVAQWRNLFRHEFQEDPIFVMAQAFNAENPIDFGFDGAIEFPPHKLTTHLVPVNAQYKYLDLDFAGNIHRYDDVVAVSLEEPKPAFPLIKTVIPSWDNDARRQGSGMAITGSTPAKYEAWLSKLVRNAKERPFFGEPMVCVNAWNEWCEGAYLEPDLHFGAAYLNATARAVAGRSRASAVPRLILVGHDAFPSGAQHLLLNIGRVLRAAYSIEFEYILLDGGAMVAEYRKHGPVTLITSDVQLAGKLRALKDSGFSGAIVNSVAAARAIGYLRAVDIEPALLVHELPRIIREKHLGEVARSGINAAAAVVFPAEFSRDSVLGELGVDPADRIRIIPQGSYKDIRYDREAGRRICAEFGVAPADRMILSVGYADLRKGFDLFLQICRLAQAESVRTQAGGRLVFVWVGGMDPGLADWLAQEIAMAQAAGHLKMAGYRNDISAFFSAASCLALTSREDPLPTVVMEALSAGVPVVAFDGSGGIPELLRQLAEGRVVPYGDTAAMARAIAESVRVPIADAERQARHIKIADGYNFQNYVGKLVDLALPLLARISVAIPSFNYAHYMPGRLQSIFQQSHPVREILVLDDCSHDDSVSVAESVAGNAGREVRVIVNERNSGSVFVQWRRAAELAQGDFVWIAEADDLSDPEFLAKTAALFGNDPHMVMAFSDSRTVDAEGVQQWNSYKTYYGTVESGGLATSEIFSGVDFVQRFLAVKNLILNVSSVVWRRDALRAALETCRNELTEFRMAGDWLLYLTALSEPGATIGYEAQPLNVHRRHATSVTHALKAERHVREIESCHRSARRMFGLSAGTLAAQAAYVEEVAEKLGVSSRAAGARDTHMHAKAN